MRQTDLTVPAGTNLTGVRLQNNEQKTFHGGIREVKAQHLKLRRSTSRKLAEVKESLVHSQNRTFTDEEVWHPLRSKGFIPRTPQLLWRAVHNAHRLGGLLETHTRMRRQS
ncbi:hypothetical protein B0H12DRAFT_1015778 [Mycena haematopus]|nr:hypothetical protein B0H12DRAFT_1015778 [Mycena haematopus]